jgi:L,D-transpeptidase catalytic domain
MRRFALLLAVLCGFFALSRPASAVTIDIDLSTQRMQVTSAAGETYSWPISSARAGFRTPHGYFKPYSLQRMHYSHKYHMSPMPYSIFFLGGYAIHGTYSTAELGRPASHGCVRLAPANAATLFSMVRQEGARISINGTPPGRTMVATNHHKRHATVLASRHKHRHHTMFASRHHHHMHAFAYAPSRHHKTLKQWMKNPGAAF